MRAVAVLLLVVACSRGAKSPQEALTRLRDAVEQGDAAAAYDLFDRETRWSIESTWKYHQSCLRVIEESYPPDEQARAAARFIDADGAPGFAAAYEARYHVLAALKPQLDALSVGNFTRDRRKRWGYSGLRAQWDDIKQRASKDLETIRHNATAYEREGR